MGKGVWFEEENISKFRNAQSAFLVSRLILGSKLFVRGCLFTPKLFILNILIVDHPWWDLNVTPERHRIESTRGNVTPDKYPTWHPICTDEPNLFFAIRIYSFLPSREEKCTKLQILALHNRLVFDVNFLIRILTIFALTLKTVFLGFFRNNM